jgi:hypothetical protein
MISVDYSLDFGDLNDFYYSLLVEEDFDFRGRDIKILISKNKNIDLRIEVSSILDLKIASSALIKSLEIIEKTNKY